MTPNSQPETAASRWRESFQPALLPHPMLRRSLLLVHLARTDRWPARYCSHHSMSRASLSFSHSSSPALSARRCEMAVLAQQAPALCAAA